MKKKQLSVVILLLAFVASGVTKSQSMDGFAKKELGCDYSTWTWRDNGTNATLKREWSGCLSTFKATWNVSNGNHITNVGRWLDKKDQWIPINRVPSGYVMRWSGSGSISGSNYYFGPYFGLKPDPNGSKWIECYIVHKSGHPRSRWDKSPFTYLGSANGYKFYKRYANWGGGFWQLWAVKQSYTWNGPCDIRMILDNWISKSGLINNNWYCKVFALSVETKTDDGWFKASNISFPKASSAYCGWTKQGGRGKDIGACNNHVYMVGMNNYLYKSNGNGGWTNVNNTKQIRRIDVMSNGDVYAIGTDGKVWQWKTNNSWINKNGTGKDIGIGGNQIYVIGNDNKIRKYNGNNRWSAPLGSGKGKNIDVSSSGTPWIKGMNDRVYQWNSNARTWNVKGTLTISDIAVKPSGGDVVVTGKNQKIYKYAGGGNYKELGGGALTLTVNSDGVPWLINKNNNLYKGKCAAKNANAETEILSITPENNLIVYPNPAQDELKIKYSAELEISARLAVYNHIGQLVISEQLMDNYITMSLEGLNNGMYILQVINGNSVENIRFIKQ